MPNQRMKFISNAFLIGLIFLGACSNLSTLGRVVPMNTKWLINTKAACSNYLYVTTKYHYNDLIEASLVDLQKKGRVTDFLRNDSLETTTFKINFIKADSINISKLLIPWTGGYSKEELKNHKRVFVTDCENLVSDTIYIAEAGKVEHKFEWDDYDIYRNYKFYPGK